MKTPLATLLAKFLPDILVPWALSIVYFVMLILVVALWARNIDPAGPYLNVLDDRNQSDERKDQITVASLDAERTGG